VRERVRGRNVRAGHPGREAGRQLRPSSRKGPSLTVEGVRLRRPVALLAGEPAGALAPRVAGAVEFRATLAWRSPEDLPRGPTLLEPPGPARCTLAETESPEAATRRLAGEVKALTHTDLGAALEAVLRALTTAAAVTEATLEVGTVRSVPPRVSSPRALAGLARDLWDAGFSVRFEPSWTPAPKADAYLGMDGCDELREFLRSHPSWSLA
jgi:hypothetical protein